MTPNKDADTCPLLEEENCSPKGEFCGPGTREISQKESKTMSVPKRKLMRWVKILIAVALLSIVSLFVKLHFFNFSHQNVFGFSMQPTSYQIGETVKYDLNEKLLSFTDKVLDKLLLIEIPDDTLAFAPDLDTCEKILGKNLGAAPEKQELYSDTVCLQWHGKVQLVIRQPSTKGSNCYSVLWTAFSKDDTLENCVQLDHANWYGGSTAASDHWPFEDVSIPMQPYMSFPLSAFIGRLHRVSYSPVLERMWMNSAGFGVFVDKAVPLHVSVNSGGDSLLCLRAKYAKSGYNKAGNDTLSLKYSVCMDRTTKHVQQHAMKNFVTLPTAAPHEELMRDPVWSTRGINMHNLTQTQALDFQLLVRDKKYNHR